MVDFFAHACTFGYITYQQNETWDFSKVHPQILSDVQYQWKKISASLLESASCHVVFTSSQGAVFNCLLQQKPVSDERLMIHSIVGIALESIGSDSSLAAKEAQFRQTFEFASIGIAMVGLKGEWISVNSSICDITGYTEAELKKTDFQHLTYPEDLEKDLSLLQQMINNEIATYTIEKRYLRKDGSIIWAILSVSKVTDCNGKLLYFISQITPIDAQKHAEEQLEVALGGLQTIINASTHVAIIGTDLNGTITLFNKGAENLLGYDAREVVGKTSPLRIHEPAEIRQREKELQERYGFPVTGFDIFTIIPKNESHDDREWTYIRKDGSRFPVQLVMTGVRNEQHEIIGYLGIATDITKIKKVEREMQSLLAVTNDQNKRLSNFAHIVSHNLRSHSGNFTLILNLLEIEKDAKTRKKILGMLRTASDNLSEAILHLNEVAVLNTTIPEKSKPINLKKALQTTLTNVELELKSTGGVCSCEIPEAIHINAIPAYLDSILLNLLTNAIKYRSPERTLKIQISALKTALHTELIVRDNGLGIDLKRHSSKLFGMYKTFHGNADARGIGLFITKNQMEAMGGRIDVESTPNIGTTFKLFFYEKN